MPSYTPSSATGGDPDEPVVNAPSPLPPFLLGDSHLSFPPNLAESLLTQPACVASIWPAFEDLRSAASATKASRLKTVLSALVSEARLVFGACFLLSRHGPSPAQYLPARHGAILHTWIVTLLAHGPPFLQSLWRWPHSQCQLFVAHFLQIAAPATWSSLPVIRAPFSAALFDWTTSPRPFPAALCTFLHSLRVGAPWAVAIDILASLPDGFFSPDGRIFAVPALYSPGGAPSHCIPLASPDDAESLTLFFSSTALVAIASSHSLLPRAMPGPRSLVSSGRGSSFSSRFLPPYIQLKKVPKRDVMSVYLSAAA